LGLRGVFLMALGPPGQGAAAGGQMGQPASGLAAPLDGILEHSREWCESLKSVVSRPFQRQRPWKDPSMDLTDEELVRLAQRDESWAFEELVRRHHGKVYSIAHHMCEGNREEAMDMTQEAFLRAFRNLRKFRGESTFYTWLYRIAINACLDGRRRRRSWEQWLSFSRSAHRDAEADEDAMAMEPDSAMDANPLEVLSGKELSGKIRRAMASLPERQRVAFQLKVLHGMNIKEISRIMGAAEGTVKSHLFRATRSLQEALKEWK